MKRKKHQGSLESRITQFIDEGIEGRRISIKKAARLYFDLVGGANPFFHVGYVRFLKRLGLSDPTMKDLSADLIGRYWEFVTQHHGTLASQNGMTALRTFWIWAARNGWSPEKRMPADLSPRMKVAKPYRVRLKIKETA